MAELFILLVMVAGLTSGLLLAHGLYALRDYISRTVDNTLFPYKPAKVQINTTEYREW